MMSLLNVGLIERITQTNVILGIALAVVGLFISLISTRLVRAIRRTNHPDPNDRIIIGMKSFGLILILVALVVIVVQ